MNKYLHTEFKAGICRSQVPKPRSGRALQICCCCWWCGFSCCCYFSACVCCRTEREWLVAIFLNVHTFQSPQSRPFKTVLISVGVGVGGVAAAAVTFQLVCVLPYWERILHLFTRKLATNWLTDWLTGRLTKRPPDRLIWPSEICYTRMQTWAL